MNKSVSLKCLISLNYCDIFARKGKKFIKVFDKILNIAPIYPYMHRFLRPSAALDLRFLSFYNIQLSSSLTHTTPHKQQQQCHSSFYKHKQTFNNNMITYMNVNKTTTTYLDISYEQQNNMNITTNNKKHTKVLL